MDIRPVDSYDELSQQAKALIVEEIAGKKDTLLCAATGDSPTKTYELLAEEYPRQPKIFDQLRIVKLDEWGGIPMKHPESCETYLQQHLIKPLKISDSRYLSFLSEPEDPAQECKRVQNELDKQGPIDVCLLGLGMNGHIALNEPAAVLQPNCHVAEISESSQQHPMVAAMTTKPTYGLTLGMADILHSKKILILIKGAHKKTITKEFLSGRITTRVPATFLWLHPNVICLAEKEAMP